MIETLKDLERLLKLCRKQGVTEITLGTTAFKLGELPREVGEPVEERSLEGFPDTILTPEQLIFYSSGGEPGDDPFRDKESN